MRIMFFFLNYFQIMRAYIDRILPMLLGSDTRTDGTKKDSCDNSSVTPPSQSLCDAYDDATTFGSCATADIAVLQVHCVAMWF